MRLETHRATRAKLQRQRSLEGNLRKVHITGLAMSLYLTTAGLNSQFNVSLSHGLLGNFPFSDSIIFINKSEVWTEEPSRLS